MPSPSISPSNLADVGPTDQQPPPSNTPSSGGQKSGSSGCVKGCLGCGCVSVIVAVLAVIGLGGMVWLQGPSTVGADSWGEAGETMTRMANIGSAIEGGGDPSDALGDQADDPRSAEGANQMTAIFDRLDATELSAADIPTIQQRLEDWESVPQVERFNDTFDSIRDLEDADSESVLQNLRMLRHFYRLFFRAGDLGDAYSDHFGSLPPEERAKQQQLTIIARTARIGTSGGEHELWEQVVADELLEFHDEHREEYEQSRALIEQMQDPDFDPQQDLSEEEQRRLQEAMGDQFVLLAAAINRSSLEAWAALSDDERQAFIETMDNPRNLIPRVIGTLVGAADDDDDGTELLYLMFLGG